MPIEPLTKNLSNNIIPNPIRMIIADDHLLFTNGIASVINETPGLALCATFLNGQQLLDWFTGKNADIILLDLHMPVLDGIETSKQLLMRFPDVKIIILSAGKHLPLVWALKEIGVFGYITKDISAGDFIRTIEVVNAGEKVFPENFEKELNQMIKSQAAELSDRELTILNLVAKGKTSKEIAVVFNLSALTIKKHRENLMRKLDAHNTAQLIEKARIKGLV